MSEQIIVVGYFDAAHPGFVRQSTGLTTDFLRADGVWTTPPGVGAPLTDGAKGDLVVSGGGTTWTIQAGAVDNSKLTQMSALSFKGNSLGATANPSDLTMTQARTMLGLPQVTTKMALKTADTQFASSTLADVPVGASGTPTLGWSVTATHSYHFRYVIVVRSASQTVGAGLAVSIPAASAFGAYGLMVGAAPAGPTALQADAMTVTDDAVVFSGVETANTDYTVIVEGMLIPSANGTLTLRARNETGATAITVRVGSFGFLTDLTP